jgi:Mn2+/Fe2+ NRAMP family transporter
LIVAGSIVGSGELIATTKTGADAGFVLLWLVILGCVVKVFTQIELGRYTLISGHTTLHALNEVPGPRFGRRGNWLVWYWMVMWLASISQLGGIVGGVGQALAISVPVTEMGADYNELADAMIAEKIQRETPEMPGEGGAGEPAPAAENSATRVDRLREAYEAKYSVDQGARRQTQAPADPVMWAALIAAITSAVLVVGRYRLIQSLSTILVGSFTLLTVLNLVLLQRQDFWRVTADNVLEGLAFRLPDGTGQAQAIGTALATFGIIGVGAAELVTYPYWCLEKGYARFTGPYDGSQAWITRARGWMRVMRFDAWGSMVVYTFATVAFYLLGAAVLHRIGETPESDSMVRTLAVMFVPVFSEWAAAVFLFGAFAVLYSTFFVANASHARVFSDALRVIGLIADDEVTRQRWIRRLSGFFPFLCLVIFMISGKPAALVLLSGVTQGIMLPMLAAAALYFRYRRCVDGLRPGSWWDAALWISALAMLITGSWTLYHAIINYSGMGS